MKQVKSRGVIIMGKSKYQEECLMILENDNFLDYDPTKKRKKKYNELYGKWKTDYHNKTTYVYDQVDLVPASFMEQPKYTKDLEMTQLMNFQYG